VETNLEGGGIIRVEMRGLTSAMDYGIFVFSLMVLPSTTNVPYP
jgi:hypothetical protein